MGTEKEVKLVLKGEQDTVKKVELVNKVVYGLYEGEVYKEGLLSKGLKSLYGWHEDFDLDWALDGLLDDWVVKVDLESNEYLTIMLPKEKEYYGDSGVKLLNKVKDFIGKVLNKVEVELEVKDVTESYSVEEREGMLVYSQIVLCLDELTEVGIHYESEILFNKEMMENLVQKVSKLKDYGILTEDNVGKNRALVFEQHYCEECESVNELRPYHFSVVTVWEHEKDNYEYTLSL